MDGGMLPRMRQEEKQEEILMLQTFLLFLFLIFLNAAFDSA